jgi:mono/diheme cytochrome c family protein
MALLGGCARRRQPANAPPRPTAFGTAVLVSSGDKQVAAVGTALGDPLVVQVNDAQGAAVPGAPVAMEAAPGVVFTPAAGITDSSGQFTATAALGPQAGHYLLTAVSHDAQGKPFEAKADEIALGYQQVLGQQVSEQYCARCHNPESTPERVSNFDNLDTKPHQFTEGDTLNKMTDDELLAIISHGGPALGRSAEMPPWGYALSKEQIQALLAYIRAVADPPYQTKGVVYAKQ